MEQDRTPNKTSPMRATSQPKPPDFSPGDLPDDTAALPPKAARRASVSRRLPDHRPGHQTLILSDADSSESLPKGLGGAPRARSDIIAAA